MFNAIAKANGDTTALRTLGGEALNVALLMPEGARAPYASSCSFDVYDLLESSASLSALFRYIRLHEWWYLTSLAMKSTPASFVIMLSSSSATAAVRIVSDISGTSQFRSVSLVPFPVDLDTDLQTMHTLGNTPDVLLGVDWSTLDRKRCWLGAFGIFLSSSYSLRIAVKFI